MKTLLLAANVMPGHRKLLMHAAGWLCAGNLLAQLLRLASSLVLTRLLMPEAFGLMAAVNTLYFGLQMFSDMGIWQSVVRSRHGNTPHFLATAWTLQIMRGLLLAIAVLLLAWLVQLGAHDGWFARGTVYADPRLAGLMAAFSLCALLQGVESIQLALAQRDMSTRPLVRLELCSQLVAILLMSVLAWLTQSVWALLAGTLGGALLKVALSYCILPRPGFLPGWHADSAREIVGFGKWTFLSSIMGFLALQSEKLILGTLLGMTIFGLYAIACNLFAAVVGLFSTLNSRLVFSSLSMVQNQYDHQALLRAYGRMQQLADLALGGLSGLMLMTGHWVMALLYDARYHDAGWMLQCLGLGLLGMRYQVLEQLMFARGQPGWVTANNALRTLALCSSVPLAFSLGGTHAALWATAVSQFAAWPLCWYYRDRLGVSGWCSLPAWPLALLAGAAAGWGVDVVLQRIA